jgi:hypothetical protein
LTEETPAPFVGGADYLEAGKVRHKFTVGQNVEVRPERHDFHIPPGTYTIVRQLPAEANDCQYRVKSARDGHERVMRESQFVGPSPLSWINDQLPR